MRFRIIRNVKELFHARAAREVFTDFVELRQRLFQAQFDKALCLDRYDLIADHIVLYKDSTWKEPIAYLRSIALETCQKYDAPMPIVPSLAHSPLHAEAYRQFEAQVPRPMNMGFLCLDMKYKKAIGDIKIIDLLGWMGYQVAGYRREDMGLCCTVNSKFKQVAWLENMGPIVQGLPQFAHPIIPDPHELVLVPKVRATYWPEQKLRYGKLYAEAEWILPESEKASVRREAA